jgi:dihydroxynaphthoic acid synthetase
VSDGDRPDVRAEERDGAVWITIDRAPVLNAFRTRTLVDLAAALWQADAGRAASVVVTGAGERAFCSGGDVSEMRELDQTSGRLFLRRFIDVVRAIRGLRKPVIARVDGYCLGGGNEINVACDLTIASDRAVFGQVGPTVGSVPVIGATQLLPRIVGEKRAREMIFLCRRYSAQEALAMGLVNRVVAPSDLDGAVREWTARLAELSPQALRIAKVSLNHAGDELEPSVSHGVEMLTASYGTAEFREGMSAFLEKRKPDFARFR